MKKIVLLSAASGIGLMVAHSAYAVEEFWSMPRGSTIGTYSGLLPPKGLYFSDLNQFSSTSGYDKKGRKEPGTQLVAYANGPSLLWVPGIKILGASYGAYISQPFSYTIDQKLISQGAQSNNDGIGGAGLYNLIVSPLNLSWNFLPLFVSTGVTFILPTGTSTNLDVINSSDRVRVGGIGASAGYASIQPDIGLTMFLPHGFSISIGEYLGIPLGESNGMVHNLLTEIYRTGSLSYHYHTGVQIMGEYMLAKIIGPWTVGIGGSTQNQLTADTQSGTWFTNPYTRGTALADAHHKSSNATIAGFTTYQFKGGLSLSAIYSHSVATYDDEGGGNAITIRVALPLM